MSNFSLKETGDSLAVSFYLGDPDNGGTLITGLNGKSVVKTTGSISAQGTLRARLQRKVPPLPAFPRIYAVIDPAGDMTEIHENNNVGWTVIGRSSFTSGVEEKSFSDPSESNSHFTKSYPNPFNESFTIEYETGTPGEVSLNVYDSRGTLVFSRGKEYHSAGRHLFEVPARDLSPGLYYYRFSNGTVTETRKIVKR